MEPGYLEGSGQRLSTLPSSLCPCPIPDLDGFVTPEQRDCRPPTAVPGVNPPWLLIVARG